MSIGKAGLEPATTRLSVLYSNQLSYLPVKIGSRGGTRTRNPLGRGFLRPLCIPIPPLGHARLIVQPN